MNLKPTYTIDIELSGLKSGDIQLVSIGAGLASMLTPFMRGPKGEKGDSGSAASISSDADNVIRLGSDGGLFVPIPELSSNQW